jgi:hypothetical protein
MAKQKKKELPRRDDASDMEPDWEHECDVCGSVPTVPETGMCGPCTFGDASTADGDW